MQWSIVDWMLMNSVPLYRILLPCSAYGYWSHRPLWYLSRPETVWMLLLAFVESHKTETDDRGRHRKTLDAVQCTKTIEWIPALPLVFDYIWVIAAHKTQWWYVETGMEGCWVCRCSVVAVAAGTKYNGIACEWRYLVRMQPTPPNGNFSRRDEDMKNEDLNDEVWVSFSVLL